MVARLVGPERAGRPLGGLGERSKAVSEALRTVARAWASDKAEREDDWCPAAARLLELGSPRGPRLWLKPSTATARLSRQLLGVTPRARCSSGGGGPGLAMAAATGGCGTSAINRAEPAVAAGWALAAGGPVRATLRTQAEAISCATIRELLRKKAIIRAALA
jgi:hypothetical protein